MKQFVILITIAFGVLFAIESAESIDRSRILAVLPFGGKSHFLAIETLLVELSRRGHDVIVVSPFPRQKPIPNYTDVDVSDFVFKRIGTTDINDLASVPLDPYVNLLFLSKFDNITKIFDAPEMKTLFSSKTERFDLVITELFNNDVMLGFVNKFKAPSIAYSSCALFPWANSRFGNPGNPSYIPVLYGHYSYRMDFLKRTYNAILSIASKLMYRFYFNYKSEYLAREYFGKDMPPLLDIGKNTSLILVNSHHSLHGARPMVPGVIEVGGMQILPPNELPKDLEHFINGSKHGVIYFCMGSMLKASTLPEDKRLDLIEVFSKLPQRVLWKWETESMPEKPDNVKLVKWMPQRDVLAHPNIKLFISHGGLLGTTEAVYSGVPIIGMPFYGDQGVNIEAVQANGAGIRLDFNDLNKDTLHKAIKEILDNPKYKENAVQLSERFRDRPQTPLETAVYWTEYVIRHKGAPHLRSAAVDLTWYQYLLLDVIAFLLLSLITVLVVLHYAAKYIYNFTKGMLFKPQKAKTKSKRKND